MCSLTQTNLRRTLAFANTNLTNLELLNENLLRRLQDSRTETEPATNTGNTAELGSFRKAIEEALAHQQSEMAAWHHKMADIGKTVSAHMANSWTELNEKWVEQQTQLGAQLLQQVQVSAAEFADQQGQQQREIGQRLDVMQNLSIRLEESFSGMEREPLTPSQRPLGKFEVNFNVDPLLGGWRSLELIASALVESED